MDVQKRWIQKAFLRPGRRFDARPRPPPSALSDSTSGETPTPLPGPPPRRGPAHGPVRPLAVGLKPGARELCRQEPFRVRPFSAEVALRESCRCFVARSRPLFQRSFLVLPLLRHLPPGRRNRPKGRNVGSRTALQAFSVPGHPRKGGSWATQGSMPSYTRGRFSAPSPPFSAEKWALLGGGGRGEGPLPGGEGGGWSPNGWGVRGG